MVKREGNALALLLGTSTLGLGLLLQILAMSTPGWMVSRSDQSQGISMFTLCRATWECYKAGTTPGQLRAVQALSIIGSLFSMIASGLAIRHTLRVLRLGLSDSEIQVNGVLMLSLCSGMFILFADIVYRMEILDVLIIGPVAVDRLKMGYSFILSIIGALFILIGGAVAVGGANVDDDVNNNGGDKDGVMKHNGTSFEMEIKTPTSRKRVVKSESANSRDRATLQTQPGQTKLRKNSKTEPVSFRGMGETMSEDGVQGVALRATPGRSNYRRVSSVTSSKMYLESHGFVRISGRVSDSGVSGRDNENGLETISEMENVEENCNYLRLDVDNQKRRGLSQSATEDSPAEGENIYNTTVDNYSQHNVNIYTYV